MAAWMELLGMLGGTVDEEVVGISVSQNSMSDLLSAHINFANKTVPNSDQMGLPADHIEAADAALMGSVLVAQRAAQPVTPVTVVVAASEESIATSLQGIVPRPPLAYFLIDPDDPTLFAVAPKVSVYHAQIGVIPRTSDFTWLEGATEFRIQRYLGHTENLTLVKDWALLADRHWTGVVWDVYIRSDLSIGYRIQFRNSSSTTEWSAWSA